MAAIGFRHLRLRKRAKSESMDASVQLCSIASAARWASETRLAVALPEWSMRWKIGQCRSVGVRIRLHG